jgi:hypothetical protein
MATPLRKIRSRVVLAALLSYLQYILLCGIGLYLGLLGYALAR